MRILTVDAEGDEWRITVATGETLTVAIDDRRRLRATVVEHLEAPGHGLCLDCGVRRVGRPRRREPRCYECSRVAMRRACEPDGRPSLDGLRRWAADHDGRSPSMREYDEVRTSDDYSAGHLRGAYSTWNAALSAAGLSTRSTGDAGHATAASTTGKRNRQMVTGGDMGAKRREPSAGA